MRNSGVHAVINIMTMAYKLAGEISSERVVVSAHRGGVEVIDKLADEWRDLCAESRDDQPFYRPEWIRAHLRAFVPGAKVLLITARLDQRLCLLLPMIEEKYLFSGLPVRRLRSPVNAHGGRFDGVRSASPESDSAVRATWDFLKGSCSWDLLEFPYAPEGGTIARLIAEAQASGCNTGRVPEKPSPYIPVPKNQELLKQMPPNPKLRSQLRQSRHRLSRRGELRLLRVAIADRNVLDRFYSLEASGWKGQQRSAILSDPRTRQFYDEIAESAARFGYFSLYMLESKGDLLAGHFAFTNRGCCYSPKVAYNENFSQFAPGHLIVSEILEDCSARGIQVFDITGPNDAWKMKWTNHTRPFDRYFVFRRTLLGRLAHVMRFRLRPSVARCLPRKVKALMHS
jgi:CelD/BcsL family acetyltransferase involved in cellulose biosynthesis